MFFFSCSSRKGFEELLLGYLGSEIENMPGLFFFFFFFFCLFLFFFLFLSKLRYRRKKNDKRRPSSDSSPTFFWFVSSFLFFFFSFFLFFFFSFHLLFLLSLPISTKQTSLLFSVEEEEEKREEVKQFVENLFSRSHLQSDPSLVSVMDRTLHLPIQV